LKVSENSGLRKRATRPLANELPVPREESNGAALGV